MRLVAYCRNIFVSSALFGKRAARPFSVRSGAEVGRTSLLGMEYINGCQFFVHDEVSSTMDRAREILQGKSGIPALDNKEDTSVQLEDSFSVLARFQNNGRGTRGRTWNSGEGNMFMTVVINLKNIPSPLSLTPLRVGTLISPHIRERVLDSRTYLKWPNDILIEDKKICGTLIEVENNFMLIGIGCNVVTAPEVIQSGGPDKGRQSTCVAAHNAEIAKACATDSASEAKSLAAAISVSICDWLKLRERGEGDVQDPAEAGKSKSKFDL